MVQAQDH